MRWDHMTAGHLASGTPCIFPTDIQVQDATEEPSEADREPGRVSDSEVPVKYLCMSGVGLTSPPLHLKLSYV